LKRGWLAAQRDRKRLNWPLGGEEMLGKVGEGA